MNKANRNPEREYLFVPRIINPIKIETAVFFAGEARIRESACLLQENMPWLNAEVLPGPAAVSRFQSSRPVVFLFDDTSLPLVDADKLKARNPRSVIALLSANAFVDSSPPQAAREKYPYTAKADLVFAYGMTGIVPSQIVTSVVRAAEDFMNIRKSSRVRRFIFLVVDDEPRWLSQFLPILYGIIGQRADVMVTRTYEEAMRFLFGVKNESQIDRRGYRSGGYGDDVVCLIADIFFPKGKQLDSDAGRDLVRLITLYYPRIPIIIASKAREAGEFADRAFLLSKGDPGSLEKLKAYINDHTGIGDFLIQDKGGKELARIKNIHGLLRIVLEAEKNTGFGLDLMSIIEAYARKDKFSTWLYMHSYRELGDILRPKRSQGRRLIALLKRHLKNEIERLDITPLEINDRKAFNLGDLALALRTVSPEIIQPLADNDIISSWLDRKGYSELAEELRPIHGTGVDLSDTLLSVIEKWQRIYARRGMNFDLPPGR